MLLLDSLSQVVINQMNKVINLLSMIKKNGDDGDCGVEPPMKQLRNSTGLYLIRSLYSRECINWAKSLGAHISHHKACKPINLGAK